MEHQGGRPEYVRKGAIRPALSFVDVDQVGDDSYERLSLLTCEAVLKFPVRILLLEAFRLPRLIPRWPQPLTSVGLQAPWWPLSNVFRSPPYMALGRLAWLCPGGGWCNQPARGGAIQT